MEKLLLEEGSGHGSCPEPRVTDWISATGTEKEVVRSIVRKP
jgi:hypothetical protein